MVAITTSRLAPDAPGFTFIPGPGAGNPDVAPPSAPHPEPISTLVAVLIGLAGLFIVAVPLAVGWVYYRANKKAQARGAQPLPPAPVPAHRPRPRDDDPESASVLREQQAAHLARLREEGLNELGEAPPPYKKWYGREDDHDGAFELQPLPASAVSPPRRPDTPSPLAVPPPVYEPFHPPPPASPSPTSPSSRSLTERPVSAPTPPPSPAPAPAPALPPPAYSDAPRLAHARMLRDLA